MKKMTIYVTQEVCNKLYEMQLQTVKDGKKKTFGDIIKKALDK